MSGDHQQHQHQPSQQGGYGGQDPSAMFQNAFQSSFGPPLHHGHGNGHQGGGYHQGGGGRGRGRGGRGGNNGMGMHQQQNPMMGYGGWDPQYGYFMQQQFQGGPMGYGGMAPSQQQQFGGGGGGRGRGNNNGGNFSGGPGVPQAAPDMGVAGANADDFDERGQEFCKALAKVAKPRPPWSIGSEPVNDISTEIGRLEAFLTPTAADNNQTRDVWDAVRNALTEVDPSPQLHYTGSNAWSFFPFRGRLHVAASGVPEGTSVETLERVLFKNGCRLEKEFADQHGGRCFLVLHSEHRREVILRLGKSAAAATETARAVINKGLPSEVRLALNALIMLLRQSKIVDDLDPSALPDEAVAIMVLSIASCYQDKPTAERLLIDFFLTFGFKAHFNSDELAVDIDGMVKQRPKLDRDAVLEVADPAGGATARNLATGLTAKKFQFMQSTFNYCYHVVSEFAKEPDPHKQRGQSPLSTILGAEPFWPRVVDLARLNQEPYASFFGQNRARAVEEMLKQRMRKAMPGRR